MNNPFNTIEKKTNPFDNTALGIGINTVKGLPKAFFDVGTSILQSITRNVASAGQTLLTARSGGSPIVRPQEPRAQKVFDMLYGKGGDVQALQQRVLKTEESIKKSPFAQKYGLDKQALPLAFAGVIGNVTLDLTPFSTEKNVIKQLAKENTLEGVAKILGKLKVPQETAEIFAPKFVPLNKIDEVKDVYTVMRHTIPAEALKDAVKSAKPLRTEIESLQSIERAKRFSEVARAQQVGGESGYFAGLSELKGALLEKPPSFTPPRDLLPAEGIDAMFTAIQRNPILNVGEQITGQNGLRKLLDGHVPVPSELKVLEEVFGSDVVRAVFDKRPLGSKVWDATWEVLADIPRALKTTLDMSATLRQGILLGLRHPVSFSKSFKNSFRSMISNNYFEKSLDEMKLTPEFRIAQDAKLALSDPRKLFGQREEYFLSNLAEKIPFIGKVVKASNRSYVGMLNSLRFSVFNDLAQSLTVTGEATQKNLTALADYINTATGRGSLGNFERSAQGLSKVFFAPRFVMSRVKWMNPVWYAKQPAPVRKEALKTMGTFVGTVTSIVTLAKMAGADVETDWRSSNFGKMKVGNSYYDLTAGFGLYVRLVGQMLTGVKKTGSGNLEQYGGDKPFSENKSDTFLRALRGKLAPFFASAWNLLDKENIVGEPVTPTSELLDSVTPLYIADMIDAVQDRGPEAIFQVGLPSFFGVGVTTYDNTSKKKNPFNQ